MLVYGAFFVALICDRQVSGAVSATAASGRRREPIQARNRETANSAQQRRAGDDVSRWDIAGSNPVLAIKKASCWCMVLFSFILRKMSRKILTPLLLLMQWFVCKADFVVFFHDK